MLASLAAALTLAPSPVVIVSWDGAPQWVISRMVEEGKLPHVQALIDDGFMAEGLQPALPSKTAVTHAAIFTGAWGTHSGITGNSVPMLPRSEHTILESRSGFSSESLMAEPIYITAAKAGKKTVVLSATQAHPSGPHVENLEKAGVPDDQYIQWSGFESTISPPLVWTEDDFVNGKMTTKIGDTNFTFIQNGETIHIRSGSQISLVRRINPMGSVDYWSQPYPVRSDGLYANAYFRLFNIGDESRLYSRKVSGLVGAASPGLTRQYIRAYGGFHDDGYGPYRAGDFGQPIYEGGDGTAEQILLETIRLDIEFLKRSFRFGMTLDPEFSSVYSLNSDSAGHLWMGILDPESPLYNKEYADKIWPYYEQVYVLQDDWLGDMREAAGPGAAFALVSDHGMEGVSARFNINRVLQDAGLLTLRTDGTVDLTKTKAMAPPWSYGSIIINTEEWANGRVLLEEKSAVKAQVREALLSATDSDGHLVTAVYDADELEQLGVSGPASGDLYYDIRKGLYESTRGYDGLTSAYSKPLGGGVHGGWSLRPKLQGICVFGGNGVNKIDSPKLVRAIDVAPTLAKLMGIPNPPQATGMIIPGAIAD